MYEWVGMGSVWLLLSQINNLALTADVLVHKGDGKQETLQDTRAEAHIPNLVLVLGPSGMLT